MTLTAEVARELFTYNPETGDLRWKVRSAQRVHVGDPVGAPTAKGYRRFSYQNRLYLKHRVVWLMQTGSWPEHFIDHRDGDRSNDRWSNLRAATHAQNAQNAKRRADNTSGFKGVSFNRRLGKWTAHIRAHGCSVFLGRHETAEAASHAYVQAATQLHGAFARLA